MTATIIGFFVLGLIIGGIVAWVIASSREKQLRAAAEAKYLEAEKNLKVIEQQLSDKFSTLSLEALSKNSEQFLKLAKQTLNSQTVEGKKELDSKKELIDQSIETIEKTLTNMERKLADVEKGSIKISTLVEHHAGITSKLQDTTEHLKNAFASPKKRGEWGERMAEDIIKLVGLIEGINYIKQKTMEGSLNKPDYTFFMPNDLKVNMDVKFPLDNYIHYLNAESEHDKKRYKDEFLKNVKKRIKEVTTRDYINPADNTVIMLLFLSQTSKYMVL